MIKKFLNNDVIWLESVDSTNEEIKRRIREFSKTTWIIAKRQSKGKGRNGNFWSTGAGNFSGSVILFPTVERAYFHLYGFFVGVALHNTIKKIANDGVDIRLKWPNDLMIENGKVAGILLESVQVPNSSRIGVIVGVGVNLNSAPIINADDTKRYNAQCVAKFTKYKIDQLDFFSKFSDELRELGSFVAEKDLRSILNLWKPRSYDIGTTIQISDSKGGTNTGTFLGLDEIGGLIVSDNSDTKRIYSGDVYFGS